MRQQKEEQRQKERLEGYEASHSETGLPDQPTAETELVTQIQKTRTIVAEILMIDGDFYVVRGDRGEIRIEVTPDTKLSENFKFGDKIRAKVLSTDEAVSVERAAADEPIGITESQ